MYLSSKLFRNLMDCEKYWGNHSHNAGRIVSAYDEILKEQCKMTKIEMDYFSMNFKQIEYTNENIIKYVNFVSFAVHDIMEIFSKHVVQKYICKGKFADLISHFDCIKEEVCNLCADDEYGVLNDDILTYISQYFIIKELDISHNNNVTDIGLKCMRHLQRLNAHRAEHITDNGIKHIASVEILDISWINGITDESIKKMTHLKILNIDHNKNITDDGIKMLDLLELNASGNSNITDGGIINMKNLQKLYIGFYVPDNDTYCCDICDIPNCISGLPSTPAVTNECIQTLNKLDTLAIPFNQYITDDGLKNIKDHLKNLYVGINGNITNEGLIELDLHGLFIGGNTNITDKGIEHLINLRTLDVSGTRITDDGIKNMQKLERLIIRSDVDDEVVMVTSHSLVNKNLLQKLDADNNIYITDNGIANLINLQELLIHGCSVTDKGIEKMENLQKLRIGGHLCEITDNAIKNKIKLKNLELLNVPGITGKCLHGLVNLENLKIELDDDNEKIFTTNDIKHLQLKRLWTSYSGISFNDIENTESYCRLTIFSTFGTLIIEKGKKIEDACDTDESFD